VKRPFDLLSQDLFYAWVVVTQSTYPDTCQQIEIALVRSINQIDAAPAFDEDVVPRVRSENVFLLEFFDV
jgi:hypothetical protein